MYILFVGDYVPLTMEGNILVDGVLASCYASYNHDLAHIVMTPMQGFLGLAEWIFGEDYGHRVYVQIAQEMGTWLLPNGHLY